MECWIWVHEFRLMKMKEIKKKICWFKKIAPKSINEYIQEWLWWWMLLMPMKNRRVMRMVPFFLSVADYKRWSDWRERFLNLFHKYCSNFFYLVKIYFIFVMNFYLFFRYIIYCTIWKEFNVFNDMKIINPHVKCKINKNLLVSKINSSNISPKKNFVFKNGP
jgi:hypothetical protein